MDKKTFKTIGVFTSGFLVGNWYTVVYFRKRVKNMQPLFTSSLINIFEKTADEEISPDELREYIANELNFLQIVLRRPNEKTS